MKSRMSAGLVWALAGLGVIGGCAGKGLLRQARLAEHQRKYHLAYEFYCQAGRERPGSRSIAADIRRVAPAAAAYWERQAENARQAGDIPRAWRLYMKTLEVRPDHPTVPETIRRLERHYPATLAEVKRAYLKGEPLVKVPLSLEPAGDKTAAHQRAKPRATRPKAAVSRPKTIVPARGIPPVTESS